MLLQYMGLWLEDALLECSSSNPHTALILPRSMGKGGAFPTAHLQQSLVWIWL